MDAKGAVGALTPERWAALKNLLSEAIALGPDSRKDFVVRARGIDAALADSLAKLLEHHDATSSPLDEPAITLDRLAALVSRDYRTFADGQIVADRFKILRFVAEGGMGEVYEAEDLELDERVALKTIRPALASDEAILARFKLEIQLARRVTHRNVSRVYDLFRHESPNRDDSIIFVSMELLEGETLAQRIRRVGRIPAGEALAIAIDLLSGLGAAHASGVIHRDFKSGNVILVPNRAENRGPGERAVITDFGLAGPRKESADAAGRLQDAAGTPAYMAPEQVDGGTATAAADIYAAGIVLFEMIAGDVPFRAASPLETARLRLHRDAPRLRSLEPGASHDWDRAVRACLRRDPGQRPSSATAVVDLLTGRARRRKNGLITLAGVMVALLVTGVWRWAHMPYRPTAAAQAAFDNGRVMRENITNSGFAASLADFKRAIELDPGWPEAWAELAYTYAAAANTQQIPATTATKEARTAALQAIRRDPRSAKAFGAFGWVQSLDFEEWPDAEVNLRRAVALDPSDAQIHYWLGVHLRKKGNFRQAEIEDRSAMVISHQSEPLYWWELAFLYWTADRLDQMQAFMSELLVAYPNFGFTRFLNARLLKEQGRYEDALSELRFSEALQYAPVTVEVERASVEAYRGNSHGARALLARLTDISKTQPVDTLLIAGVYARLGDADAAFGWLQNGYARRDSTLLSIGTSPLLKPLRNDARFSSLTHRLHFDR